MQFSINDKPVSLSNGFNNLKWNKSVNNNLNIQKKRHAKQLIWQLSTTELHREKSIWHALTCLITEEDILQLKKKQKSNINNTLSKSLSMLAASVKHMPLSVLRPTDTGYESWAGKVIRRCGRLCQEENSNKIPTRKLWSWKAQLPFFSFLFSFFYRSFRLLYTAEAMRDWYVSDKLPVQARKLITLSSKNLKKTVFISSNSSSFWTSLTGRQWHSEIQSEEVTACQAQRYPLTDYPFFRNW